MAESLTAAPRPGADKLHPHPARPLCGVQIHPAPRRRKPWPTRESSVRVKFREGRHFRQWKVQGGRWEVERRCPRTFAINCFGSISIQENNGELRLNRPEFGTLDDWMAFLKWMPNIHSLDLDSLNMIHGLLAAVPELFPKVSSLEISDHDCDTGTLEKLLGSSELLSLTLHLFTVDQDRVLRVALANHSNVLTSLITEDMDMDEFHVVVAACPALRILNIEYLCICGSELEVPTWVCTELRELSFVLQYGVGADGYMNADAKTLECQELAAERVASLFMKQLGAMSALESLTAAFHNEGLVRDSPFLQLTLDPVSGLPQLSGLKRLENLAISGVLHRVGQEEIEWMTRTWPRLATLEIPMLRQLEADSNVQVLEMKDMYQGQVPEYSKWCPQIEARVPIQCYGNWTGIYFCRGTLDWTWVYYNERIKYLGLD